MHGFPNARFSKCTVFQMHGFPNARFSKCTVFRVHDTAVPSDAALSAVLNAIVLQHARHPYHSASISYRDTERNSCTLS
jgi:hypothetical protein